MRGLLLYTTRLVMPLPDSWTSAFAPSLLQTFDAIAEKLRVRDIVFYRSAFTGAVIENERRSFAPLVVLDGAMHVSSARCTCSEQLRIGDLCRHVAMLLRAINPTGELRTLSERFDSSPWRAAGHALFEAHRNHSLKQRTDGSDPLTSRTLADLAIVASLRHPSAMHGRFASLFTDDSSPVDAREQTLRRLVLTAQELELVKRGAASARLAWESSFWYRWSKLLFQLLGEHAPFTLQERDGDFHLRVSVEDVVVEALMPHAGVDAVLAADGEVVRRSGFSMNAEGLIPSFRVSVSEERALVFTPALIDGTVDRAEPRIYTRAELETQRFGRFYFLPDAALFATVRNVPPMFDERPAGQQATLFASAPAAASSGFSYDRETRIPEGQVLRFIERHRDELLAMPAALVADEVRNARPVRATDGVLFTIEGGSRPRRAARADDQFEIDIAFEAGDALVPVAEIVRARRAGIRALNRGHVWLDVADAQFAWIDSLRAEQLLADGRLRISTLEYLRIRGSLRGRPRFEGDAAGERMYRLYDDMRATIDAPSPSELGMDLYGYQQTGYQWLWFLQQNGFGGLLCDDMGLGKTHQAMALIRGMSHGGAGAFLSALVVCPTSLLDHWREKLAQYVPDVAFHVHHGAGRSLRPDARCIITSYGVLRSDAAEFRGRHFDLMVLDEAQTLKNRGTATYQALRTIEKRIAIGLTGTPVENRLAELKSLLDFVLPNYLPGDAEFERQFSAPIESGDDVQARDRLQQLIRPFVLRRTKAQVLTQLPPKIVDKRHCELTPEQLELYRRIVDSKGAPLRAQMREGGAAVPYLHIFAALNYLKQICNHPASLGGALAQEVGAGATSGKWNLFVELMDECMASGLKVVVFSQYVKMLDLIERHLTERRIGFASIKGSTVNRGAEIRRFRDAADCRVFTASLRAGGLGIDLTSASVVIHYDRWWNQAREDQATDRVHRHGQNKGVQVIKLITRGTLEEKIDRLIEQKSRVANSAVATDDPTLVKQFTPAELDELLTLE